MLKKIIVQILFYITLIVLWQSLFVIGVRLEWWKSYAFPYPLGVWEAFLKLFKRGTLHTSVIASLNRVLIGYSISVAFGGFCGLALTQVKILRETVRPLLLGIQTLPSICWVPFAILWFGLQESAIIFVTVVGSTFCIAISIDSAFRNVSPLYINVAKTLGTGRFTLWTKVILPASFPMIISSLKHGWSFAWRALMAGEVMSATIGLGQALTMGRDLADINRVALVMLLIIIIGSIIDKLIFDVIERHLLKKRG
jgi:NitT/TauT family transport system permease protein